MDGARVSGDCSSFSGIFVQRLSFKFNGAVHGWNLFDKTYELGFDIFQGPHEVGWDHARSDSISFPVVSVSSGSELDPRDVDLGFERQVLEKAGGGSDGEDKHAGG
jgi:hypothetical protein